MSEPGSSPSGLHPQATQKAESGPGPGRRTRFTPAKPSWPSQARATSQKAKVSDWPQAAASCGGQAELASRLRSHPGLRRL